MTLTVDATNKQEREEHTYIHTHTISVWIYHGLRNISVQSVHHFAVGSVYIVHAADSQTYSETKVAADSSG